MTTGDIILLIKRRQAKIKDAVRRGRQSDADEAARLMIEEYDSLLAEIAATQANEIAEHEILGDQGQSGG